MKINLDKGHGNRIRHYAPGQITINDQVVTTSTVVLADRTYTDWAPASMADLKAAHLATIADMGPEILLLGTGASLCFPQPALMAVLMERGIGLEVMDTPAACRTFNILMEDRRNVAAALFMI
ncbi:MAG: Xcc1710-like domain-containing protein [Gammaproteobacteria bacterium]|nr:Xcc1710-like domain-containing protein [Gammaproteobacteria bacterium]